MTDSQQRRGWFRLAFAAAAFALLLALVAPERPGSHRAQAGITLSPGPSSLSFSARLTSWEWSTHGTGADYIAWSAILPVFFVGLLAPLVLLFVSAARAEPHPAAPGLTSLFQRPPPAQTL
jgi:hypothetical protein